MNLSKRQKQVYRHGEHTWGCQRRGGGGMELEFELPERMIIHRMGKNNKVLLHRWETMFNI